MPAAVSNCLLVGPEAVEVQCQRLEVRDGDGGRLLFTADEEEVAMLTDRLTVTGKGVAGLQGDFE